MKRSKYLKILAIAAAGSVCLTACNAAENTSITASGTQTETVRTTEAATETTEATTETSETAKPVITEADITVN